MSSPQLWVHLRGIVGWSRLPRFVLSARKLHRFVGVGTNGVILGGHEMFARSRNIDYKFTDIVINKRVDPFHHLAAPDRLCGSSWGRRDDQHNMDDYGIGEGSGTPLGITLQIG
jgi:hypothetical protein